MPLYTQARPDTVCALFSAIAKSYDTGNSILSFGLHHYWNRQLVTHTITKAIDCHLDLCAGTGAIGFKALSMNKDLKHLILLDFCANMLEVAKKRAPKDRSIEFIEGDAHFLPQEDNQVDAITMAYGIRNLHAPQEAIIEAYRVLKPGGVFGILELTRPKNQLLRTGHKIYLNTLLPIMGALLSKQKDAYHYLSHTVQTFAEPCVIKEMMENAGFRMQKPIPMTGGIATIILGKKPGG